LYGAGERLIEEDALDAPERRVRYVEHPDPPRGLRSHHSPIERAPVRAGEDALLFTPWGGRPGEDLRSERDRVQPSAGQSGISGAARARDGAANEGQRGLARPRGRGEEAKHTTRPVEPGEDGEKAIACLGLDFRPGELLPDL